MNFSQLPIARRLTILTAITGFLLVCVGAMAIWKVDYISTALATNNDYISVKQRYAINFRGSVHDRAVALRDVVLIEDQAGMDKAVAEIEKFASMYAKSAASLDATIREHSADAEQTRMLASIQAIEKTTMPEIDQIIQMRRSGDVEAARDLLVGQVSADFTTWLARIDEYIDYNEALSHDANASVVHAANTFIYPVGGLTVVGLIIAFLVGRRVSTGITEPIGEVSERMKTLVRDMTGNETPDAGSGSELDVMTAAMDALSGAATEREDMMKKVKEAEEKVRADQAETVLLLRDVTNVVESAKSGVLSARISAKLLDSDLGKLKNDLNDLLDVFDNVVDEAGTVMAAVSNGDLGQRMDPSRGGAYGELAGNVNESLEQMQDIVMAIQGASNAIHSSTSTIISGARSLSERTESQAAALEETAATMEEMTATVKSNAVGASTADNLSSSTAKTAQDGGCIADEAIKVMGSIQESANKIKEITAMVDGIAFQTNLLALNAAVEAARAGDAGKGFAVVAQEVRTLAQRAAEAAQDIGGLVSESIDHISRGVERVEATGQSLESIRSGIGEVSNSISEITGASQEQATGIQEISTALSKLDNETQQNASLASDSATAAAALGAEADRLTSLLSRFQGATGGSARRAS